jgi:hypothetical protein
MSKKSHTKPIMLKGSDVANMVDAVFIGPTDSNLQPNDYQPPALSIEHSGSRALTAVSDRAFS